MDIQSLGKKVKMFFSSIFVYMSVKLKLMSPERAKDLLEREIRYMFSEFSSYCNYKPTHQDYDKNIHNNLEFESFTKEEVQFIFCNRQFVMGYKLFPDEYRAVVETFSHAHPMPTLTFHIDTLGNKSFIKDSVEPIDNISNFNLQYIIRLGKLN